MVSGIASTPKAEELPDSIKWKSVNLAVCNASTSFSLFRLSMRTVLVTGGANGLGQAFVTAYKQDVDTRVIALDQLPISSNSSNVESIITDVASEESIQQCAEKLKDVPIDLLIHSAGIRGLVPEIEATKPDDVAACETMDVMDAATMQRTFQINATGTFILIRALLPNLRLAKNAKVVVMSSRMGSIGNNERPKKDAGSAFAYRASKAALNTIVRSFAADISEVTFILCHPGRVETKLVRSKEAGAISVEESLSTILPLIERWSAKDSGRFFDRFGETIEW